MGHFSDFKDTFFDVLETVFSAETLGFLAALIVICVVGLFLLSMICYFASC
jgi:hypothetical protein